MVKRISVDLADDLYERLRLAAYQENLPISEAVRERLVNSLPQLPETSAPATTESEQP